MDSISFMLNREQIIEVFKTTKDPEINLDLWIMGLIYEFDIAPDGALTVTMTLTSPACPLGETIVQTLKKKFLALGCKSVEIKIVFEPPWKMSDEMRRMLGI